MYNIKTIVNTRPFQPYDFQVEGSNFILERKHCLIGDEMGLGKTLQVILSLSKLNHLKKVLIICPKHLIWNWYNEFHKFTDIDMNKVCAGDIKHLTYKVKTGSKVNSKGKSTPIYETRETDLNSFNIVITNYESLERNNVRKYFSETNYFCADEAHKLKSPSTIRTKEIIKQFRVKRPEYVVFLSGTPIYNKVNDLYQLLSFLYWREDTDIGIKFRSKYTDVTTFANHFCYVQNFNIKTPWGYKSIPSYFGCRNKEELHKLLVPKYIGRKAKDYLNLPNLNTSTLFTKELDEKVLKEYEVIFERGGNVLNELRNKDAVAFNKKKYDSAAYKINYTQLLVTSLLEADENNKIVIFTDFVQVAKDLNTFFNGTKEFEKDSLGNFKLDDNNKKIEKTKIKAITGELSSIDRQNTINKFNEDKDLKVLVLTFGAGSSGFNITSSNYLIFNDLNYTPSEVEQATKRIHRIGQERECYVQYLIHSEIDYHIIDLLLSKKQSISDALTI